MIQDTLNHHDHQYNHINHSSDKRKKIVMIQVYNCLYEVKSMI
jgi:hypothetical protein